MQFRDLSDIDGLTLIPLNGKIPAVKEWQKRRGQSEEDIKSWIHSGYNVGLLCGSGSNGIEVLDVDSKFQLAGDNIMKRWADIVNEQDRDLLSKLLVTRTISGGYHVIYRCAEVPIEGNRKLAMRPPTAGETGQKSVCLIETRGEGGQIRAYEPIRGSYGDIPTITEEERDIIIDSACSMNELIMPTREHRERLESVGLSPMDAYDQECDSSVILALLEEYGWSIHADKGDKWELTRPGKTRGISATLDFHPGMFWTWSGAGQFDENKGYTYAGVYTQLVHNGDAVEATKALAKEGYGEQPDEKERLELIDKMLGKSKDPVFTDEEEERILSRLKSSKQCVDEYIAYIRSGKSYRLSERFQHLMSFMQDISPGQVVGIAGSSGSGKSLVLDQLNEDYANLTESYGMLGSLEMTGADQAARKAMTLSDPDEENMVSKSVATKNLLSNQEFYNKVISAGERVKVLDDSYNIDEIFEIAAVYKRHLERNGDTLSFVSIDFQSLLDGGADIDKQASIAQKLKVYAKKLNVIVFVLQQFNGTMDKYDEPTTSNAISGRRDLFMMLDFSFMIWKSRTHKGRIRLKNSKERWSGESVVDLVSRGMYLYSAEHISDDKHEAAKAAGNVGI
jgi:hypothetical protein